MDSLISTLSDAIAKTGKVGYDIAFPHLNIFIKTLKNTITIGNFTIAYYGIIIAIAMLVAFTVVVNLAKKKKISEDYYYDIFIMTVILGIVGARAYYVIFNWDYYSLRPYEILDLRAGGLAVFGGIILVAIGVFVYCKIKKCNFLKIIDIAFVGLPLGQAIGRYGNFFNMEAFGGFTNNIFAMRMRYEYIDKSVLDLMQLANIIEEDGVQYIQAHPTFFYESTLNIILFIILLYMFHKFYKFEGQLLATYLIGYGIIRFFIESLRTDSLMIGSLKISQIVALICMVIGIVVWFINRNKVLKVIKTKRKKKGA